MRCWSLDLHPPGPGFHTLIALHAPPAQRQCNARRPTRPWHWQPARQKPHVPRGLGCSSVAFPSRPAVPYTRPADLPAYHSHARDRPRCCMGLPRPTLLNSIAARRLRQSASLTLKAFVGSTAPLNTPVHQAIQSLTDSPALLVSRPDAWPKIAPSPPHPPAIAPWGLAGLLQASSSTPMNAIPLFADRQNQAPSRSLRTICPLRAPCLVALLPYHHLPLLL